MVVGGDVIHACSVAHPNAPFGDPGDNVPAPFATSGVIASEHERPAYLSRQSPDTTGTGPAAHRSVRRPEDLGQARRPHRLRTLRQQGSQARVPSCGRTRGWRRYRHHVRRRPIEPRPRDGTCRRPRGAGNDPLPPQPRRNRPGDGNRQPPDSARCRSHVPIHHTGSVGRSGRDHGRSQSLTRRSMGDTRRSVRRARRPGIRHGHGRDSATS